MQLITVASILLLSSEIVYGFQSLLKSLKLNGTKICMITYITYYFIPILIYFSIFVSHLLYKIDIRYSRFHSKLYQSTIQSATFLVNELSKSNEFYTNGIRLEPLTNDKKSSSFKLFGNTRIILKEIASLDVGDVS